MSTVKGLGLIQADPYEDDVVARQIDLIRTTQTKTNMANIPALYGAL